MHPVLSDSVVSEDRNEITLQWRVENPFQASEPSDNLWCGSTRTKVFEEDWRMIIKACVLNLNCVEILIRKENFKICGDSKGFQFNFELMKENGLLIHLGGKEVCFDNAEFSFLFPDALRELRNPTISQIVCTAKWLNTPVHGTSFEQKYGQESFKDRQNSLKLTLPEGRELLSRDFQELLQTSRNADVHIKVKEKTILAHQAVLEARCPVFAAMFSHNMEEKLSRVVTITDCEPASFQDFLTYLYTGQVDHITGSNAYDLFKISDKYNRPELKGLCKKYLLNNLASNTFLDTLSIADMYDDSELMESVTKYFAKNGSEIIKTTEWQDFLKNYPNLVNKVLEELFRMDAFASLNSDPSFPGRRRGGEQEGLVKRVCRVVKIRSK